MILEKVQEERVYSRWRWGQTRIISIPLIPREGALSLELSLVKQHQLLKQLPLSARHSCLTGGRASWGCRRSQSSWCLPWCPTSPTPILTVSRRPRWAPPLCFFLRLSSPEPRPSAYQRPALLSSSPGLDPASAGSLPGFRANIFLPLTLVPSAFIE